MGIILIATALACQVSTLGAVGIALARDFIVSNSVPMYVCLQNLLPDLKG